MMNVEDDFVTVKIRVKRDQKSKFLGTFYLLKSLIDADGTILGGKKVVGIAEREYLRFLKQWVDILYIPSLDGQYRFESWQMPTVPECVGIGQCLEDKFLGDTDAPDWFVPPTVWDTEIAESEKEVYDKISVFFNQVRPSITQGLKPNRKEELIRFVLHYVQELKIQKFEADQYFLGSKQMGGIKLPSTIENDWDFDSAKAALLESVFLPSKLQLATMAAQLFDFGHGEHIIPEHGEITATNVGRVSKGNQDRIIAWLYGQSVFTFPDLMSKSQNARVKQIADKNILEVVGFTCSLLGLLLDEKAFDEKHESMFWFKYLTKHVKSSVERAESAGYSNLPKTLGKNNELKMTCRSQILSGG